MKYKVGDKVKVKSLEWYNKNKTKSGFINYRDVHFTEDMSIFCGCILTIKVINKDIYDVEENVYIWTEDMFEGLADYKENIEITLNDKKYIIDVKKAMELGVVKEKDSRCKSWEEFRLKYKNRRGYSRDSLTDEIYNPLNPIIAVEQLTENEAIAIHAFSRLLKLRRDWIGTWDPDWSNGGEIKFCIDVYKNDFCVTSLSNYSKTFSFPTEEMAEEFLECFRDLFEQCKILI